MKLGSKRTGGGWIPFIILIISLGVGLLIALWQWDSILSTLCMAELEQERAECEKRIETILAGAKEQDIEQREEMEEGVPDSSETLEIAEQPEPTAEELKWVKVMGTFPAWPNDFATPQDCNAVREDLLTICRELDSRPYMQTKELSDGSYGLLKDLAKALAKNPPVASGEMLRYESFTANVFHIFRALGKSRTYMLIEILAREQDLAEPMAMALFRWLLVGEKCADKGGPMSFQVLYDYAAYLLNTLGGHAYVNRRNPKVAALTSFYALVVIDQAIGNDYNPHGVDPRPHIRRCRALMKLQDSVFKDRYLELLQDMEKRWR